MKVSKNTAQVEVVGPFGSVYLFSQKGSGVIGSIHRALNKKTNWNDPDYLTRMIFCEMVPDEERYTTDKFGIGTQLYADVDLLITINTISEKVIIQSKGASLHDKYIMSFEDFINNFTSNARL